MYTCQIIILALLFLTLTEKRVLGQTVTCFGVASNDSTVCSSHGFCIARDTCICHDGYNPKFNCLKRYEGRAFSAGDDDSKQLGDTLNIDSVRAPSSTMVRVGDPLGLMRLEMVSSGSLFSLALNSEGEVFGWGANNYGQLGRGSTSTSELIPTIIEGDMKGKRIVSIAACFYHALAADSNGKVYAWGTNSDSNDGGWLGTTLPTTYKPTLVSNLNNVVKVVCGRYHSAALTSNLQVFTWGANPRGQLGVGSSNPLLKVYTPTEIKLNNAPRTCVDIVSGANHMLVLDNKNQLFAWGSNVKGQIGINDAQRGNVLSPVLVPFSPGNGQFVSSIAASVESSFAIVSNGSVYSWGGNSQGELANPNIADDVGAPTRATLLAGMNVSYISSGFHAFNAYARTESGWFGWGNNAYGQFGLGITGTHKSALKPIASPYSNSSIAIVSSGRTHSLYLIESNIMCYSLFSNDPLVCSGHGTCTASDTCNCESGYSGYDCSFPRCGTAYANDPMVCSGHGQCLTVDICLCHQGYSGVNCEIKDEGYLFASGDNSLGQLVDDNFGLPTISRLIPVQSQVFARSKVHLVAGGQSHSLILLSNGTLYSVGLNNYGQLGDGSLTNRVLPVPIGPFGDKAAVGMCGGLRHSLVIDASGRVWSFGDNTYGQLGNNGGVDPSASPILVRGALMNEIVVSVACGYYHSMALTRNGTLYTWGVNSNDQLGDGTGANKKEPQLIHLTGRIYKRRISAISAGSLFSMAIADDGTLYRWGANGNGQLGDTTIKRKSLPIALQTSEFASKTVIGISGGNLASFIITSDGALYATGSNTYGQLGIGSSSPANRLSYEQVLPSLSLVNVRKVFSGCNAQFASAITNDSIAYIWGENTKGQLGDGTMTDQRSPIRYNAQYPNRPVVSISVGQKHTLVLYGSGARTSAQKLFSCFGVLSDDHIVCSHHGNCTGEDQCSCQQGYSGQQCEQFTCGGIARTDVAGVVCMGRGKCVGLDICVCDPGFSGSNCERVIRGVVFGVGRNQPSQLFSQLASDDVEGDVSSLLRIEGLPNRILITKVDGGNSFSAALTADGDLYTWGYNGAAQLGDNATNGRSRPVLVLSQVIDFCAGHSRMTAIKQDFSVWAWGRYVTSTAAVGLPKPTKITGLKPEDKPRSVACGNEHTLILTDAGIVYSFGNGGDGVLGVGSTGHSLATVRKVLGLSNIVQVSCGDRHSLALGSSGQLFAWGLNTRGQLGDMTTTDKTLPVLVAGTVATKMIVKISGSMESSFAVTNDGAVYSWGGNTNSILGDASIPQGPTGRAFPGLVKGLDGITIVDIYSSRSNGWATAINVTGVGYSWGYNTNSNLGDKTKVIRTEPTAQTINENYPSTTVASIGAAYQHSLILLNGTICYGILADDPLVCSWRGNCVDENRCDCQNGYFGNECELTKCFGVNSNDSSVCSGRGTCIARDMCSCTSQLYSGDECETIVQGVLFGVGGNNVGQLGDGSNVDRSQLVLTSPPLSTMLVRHVVSGQDFSLAITLNGELYSWGSNAFYNLGIGSKANQFTPQQLLVSKKFVSATASRYHAAAVSTEGKVYTWGSNTMNGNTFYIPGTGAYRQVECSEIFCCAENDYACNRPTKTGMLGLGSTYIYSSTPRPVSGINETVIAVSCGLYHCLAFTSSGGLWSWGDNTYGQLGNGEYGSAKMQYSPVRVAHDNAIGGVLSNVKIIAVSAGSYHSMVLSSLGEVFVWGSEGNGQIGDGVARSISLCRFPKRPTLDRIPIKAVSSGTYSSYAIGFDGSLFVWGWNSNGQLGINSTSTVKVLTPVLVRNMTVNVLSASTLSDVVLAADFNGAGYGWGLGSKNQLLNGMTSKVISPLPINYHLPNSTGILKPGNLSIVAAAAGYVHSLFIFGNKTTTKTRCFGVLSHDPLVCRGHGRCTSTNHCNCDYGYTGDSCEVLTCFGLPSVAYPNRTACSSYGQCTNVDTCECYAGRTGRECQFNVCFSKNESDPLVCGGHGHCIAPDQCRCDVGYNGTECEIPLCFNHLATDINVCSSNGTCTSPNNCACRTGRTGERCEMNICFNMISNDSLVCSGHGQCILPDVCRCTSEYTGANCTVPICYGIAATNHTVCGGSGSMCTSPNNCTCIAGKTGNRCEIDKCFGLSAANASVCSGHGQCISIDTCHCTSGYTGGNCAYPICKSKHLDQTTGMEIIVSLPALSTELVLTTAMDCSGHGTCVSPNNCQCSEGYTDQYCSTPTCFGLAASDPASCNHGKNGTCVAPNNCTCLTDRDIYGNCFQVECFGKNRSLACNNHLSRGDCVAVNQCSCSEGYGGLECEQYVCQGILESNRTFVCHGRGHCTSPNQCECQSGYNGTDCELINCYGRTHIDGHHVCSGGRGVCIGPNSCQCHSGYVGDECQYRTCFGRNETDAHVCYGHGICSNIDHCDCISGWTGTQCQIPLCFGVNATDGNACNGHGSCTSVNQCACQAGWSGAQCTEWLLVKPNVTYNQLIGPCDDIVIVALPYSGAELYHWSVMQGNNMQLINQHLENWKKNTTVSIPFTLLDGSTYVFNLHVQLGKEFDSDTSVIRIQRNETKSMIGLYLKGSTIVHAKIGRPNIVEVDIHSVSCLIGRNISIEWKQVSGRSFDYYTDGKSLVIPSHSFIALGNVVQLESFQFVVIARYELFTENVTVILKPVNTPISAFIQGGDRRILETDDILLDGRGSFDPDNTTEVTSYVWSCYQIKDRQESRVQLPPKLSLTTPLIAIEPRALPTGTYRFYLNFTKGYRTDTRSVNIEVLPQDVSSLKVSIITGSFFVTNRAKETVITSEVQGQRGTVRYEWFEVHNQLDLKSRNIVKTRTGSNNLIIAENVLQPGRHYTFRLDVTDSVGTRGNASITLIVRTAAIPGDLTLIPNNEDQNSRNVYRITANNFLSDEGVLKYAFGYYKEDDQSESAFVSLQDIPLPVNEINTTLPTPSNGTLLIAVRAYDWFGAMIEVSTRFNISNTVYTDEELVQSIQKFRSDLSQEGSSRSIVTTKTMNILNTLTYQNENMTEETADLTLRVKEDIAQLLSNVTTDEELITDEFLQMQSHFCTMLTSDPSRTSEKLLNSSISFAKKLNSDLRFNYMFDFAKVIGQCTSNLFVGLSVARNQSLSTYNETSTVGQMFRKNYQVLDDISSRIMENTLPGTLAQSLITDTFSATIYRDDAANVANRTIRIDGVTRELTTSIQLPSSFNTSSRSANVFQSNSTQPTDIGVRALLAPSPYFDSPSSQNITAPVVLSLTFDHGKERANVSNLIEPILFTIPIPSPGLNLLRLNRNESKKGYRPFCKYWDEQHERWSTDGCTMVNYTRLSITCACNHTTDFGAFIEFAIPNLQFLNAQDFRNITKLNKDNMATMILMASLALAYLAIVLMMTLYNVLKPVYILHRKRKQVEKHGYVTNDNKWRLFHQNEGDTGKLRKSIWSFISDHPYLSLFVRSDNSFGKIRKISVIYASLLGIFTGNAITFGTEAENGVQFLVSAIVSEIISAPFVAFFTVLFASTQSLPRREVRFTIDDNDGGTQQNPPKETEGYYQYANYPRSSRFYGQFGTTSTSELQSHSAQNSSKLHRYWQKLNATISNILDWGDAVLTRMIMGIKSFLERITWQSLIFLVIISIGYAGCVVGVMALVRLNFGSWFNFDYQFGIGTLLIVIYFIFLEVTYLRIRYQKFVNRRILQWRLHFAYYTTIGLLSLSVLMILCGLVPVFVLVTPPQHKHPWFLRVLFVMIGLFIVAVSGIIFLVLLSWNVSYQSMVDDYVEGKNDHSSGSAQSNNSDEHFERELKEIYSISNRSHATASTSTTDGDDLSMISTSSVSLPTDNGSSSCQRQNVDKSQQKLQTKSLFYYVAKWWNSEHWFSWHFIPLWYMLFGIYIFGCSFILVLYGIKFEQETTGWVLGCGTGVAEDIFIKPVTDFIVHNVVYIAIMELIAGLFFGRPRKEKVSGVKVILNHMNLPVEEVSATAPANVD